MNYAKKASKNAFQIIHFVSAVAWGWYELKDKPYFPWFLGGRDPNATFCYGIDGSMGDENPGPWAPNQESLMNYYLITAGYHWADGIRHAFFQERMSDFHEMTLHHIAAVSLLFASSYGQFMGTGSVVAYLHDITDIFGCACKLFNCTIY